MTPTDLALHLEHSWDNTLLFNDQKKAAYKPRSVWASRWSPCLLEMVLDLIAYKERKRPDAGGLTRMALGKEVERWLIRLLDQAGQESDPGFRLIGQEEHFELNGKNGKVVQTGKLDTRIIFDGDKTAYPAEIKWGDAVRRVNVLADFDHSPWTIRMPYQLLSYLLGNGEPWGFFIIMKPSGPHVIPVELEKHLDKAEDFLARAEEAMEIRDSLPEQIFSITPPEINLPYHDDRSWCRRCNHYQRSCFPPDDQKLGAQILDESIEQMLDRRQELKEAHDECKEIDEDLKEKLRGVETGIVGRWLVTGKWTSGKKIPKAIRDEYGEYVEKYAWRKKFECLDEED